MQKKKTDNSGKIFSFSVRHKEDIDTINRLKQMTEKRIFSFSEFIVISIKKEIERIEDEIRREGS